MTGPLLFGLIWAALCLISLALFGYLIATAPMESDHEEN